MHPDPFHENLSLLRAQAPRLHARILSLTDTGDACRVVPSESGPPSLLVRGGDSDVLIHSRRDPIREAERIVKGRVDGEEDLVVLLGFGLGYLAERILVECRSTFLVVIEPRMDVFVRALRTRHLTEVLGSHRVCLVIGGDEPSGINSGGINSGGINSGGINSPGKIPWDDVVPDTPLSRMKLIVHRPYSRIDPERARTVAGDFYDFRRRRTINTATLMRFDRLWTRNTFKNAAFFFSRPGIREIEGALRGFGVLVLGAGPSLERSVDAVRELQERAFTVSADTALVPLLHRGIVPDFVVSVDPQFINSLYVTALSRFRNIPGDKLPVLVSDPAVYPTTLRCYPGLSVLSSSVFSPGKIVERFSGKKGDIAAGGSVMTTAFDFARIAGGDPIALLGLDLCYSRAKTHLSGSLIEEFLLSRANRISTALTSTVAYVRGGRPVTLRDRDGAEVLTDSRLLLYRSWFAGQRLAPGTYNATEGGLDIEGMRNVQTPELFGLLPDRAGDKREVRERLILSLRGGRIDRRRVENFLDYLRGIGKGLGEIRVLCREGIEILKSGEDGHIPSLDRIDGRILAHEEENRIISMVMQKPIHRALTGREGDIRETSIDLYSAIDDASALLLEIIGLTHNRSARLLSRGDRAPFGPRPH
jgi:hypothetical protein